MQKFTVFTVILTILVVVVAAETFVNKYLPALSDSDEVVSEDIASTGQYTLPSELDLSSTIQGNVLGASDLGTSDLHVDDSVLGVTQPLDTTQPLGETQPTQSVNSPQQNTYYSNNFEFLELEEPELLDVSNDGYFDIEEFSSSFDQSTTNVFLRDDQIANSGFVGSYLEPDSYDGFLYKTINIGDLYGVSVSKYVITNGTTSYAKIYILISEDVSNLDAVYDVLKVRASEGLEVELNETNQYGSASFFMNDSRRESVAFLTCRIGSRIYGFSYPKQYHPQIRNLVSILMLDSR